MSLRRRKPKQEEESPFRPLGTIFGNKHPKTFNWAKSWIEYDYENYMYSTLQELYKNVNPSPLSSDIDFKLIKERDVHLGIEVEMELGTDTQAALFGGTNQYPGWFIKEDHSLRDGGAEFISWPLLPRDVPKIISVLEIFFKYKRINPSFSWRTSNHVHLDVRNLRLSELISLLLIYIVLENVLFEFSSPGRRETNIFCTPLTRTDMYLVGELLRIEVPTRTCLYPLFNSLRKYSALNLNRIIDYGTVEFRHLRGTLDSSFMTKWISVILKIYEASIKFSPEKLERTILTLNTSSEYEEFLVSVVGESLSNLFIGPNYKFLLSKGISCAKELLFGLKIERKLKVSKDAGIYKFIELQNKVSKPDRLKIRAKNQGSIATGTF